MKLNERDQRICDKYSTWDAEGFVHCHECPLRIGDFYGMCKANSTYNRHTREWEADIRIKNAKENTDD